MKSDLRKRNLLLEFWRRYGDMLLWGLIIVLVLGWGFEFFLRRPNRIDLSETVPVRLDASRALTQITPFPANTRLARKSPGTDLDAVLALDISGSMDNNDSEYLTRSSAKMLIDLLSDKSRVGAVLYNSEIADSFPLSTVASANGSQRETHKEWFDRFSYTGGTNIEAGMTAAVEMLDLPADGNADVILFMTDADDLSLFVSNWREKLAQSGIRVMPIGFGKRVKTRIFEKLSYEQHEMVETATDLPLAYATVFSRLVDTKPFEPTYQDRAYTFGVAPEVIGLNIIVIADDVGELTYRLFGPLREITLVPDSEPGALVGGDAGYIVIKLDRKLLEAVNPPGSGSFSLSVAPEPQRTMVIPIYDLSLDVELGGFDEVPKTGEVKRVRLVDSSGETYVDPQVAFEIVFDGPAGRLTFPIDRQIAPGEFSAEAPFPEPGEYTFFFTATHPDFTKESERLSFNYSEVFEFDLVDSTIDLGTYTAGRVLAVELIPNDPSFFGYWGERFDLSLDTVPSSDTIELIDPGMRLHSRQPTALARIRTKQGLPFGPTGTAAGDYVSTLAVTHALGSTDRVELSYSIGRPGLLDLWIPVLISMAVWIIAIVVGIGMIRYTPFPRRISVIRGELRKRGRLAIDWHTFQHPGNWWVYGRPRFILDKGVWVQPVRGSSDQLELVYRDDDEPVSERFQIKDDMIIMGRTGYLFRPFRRGDLRSVKRLFDRQLREVSDSDRPRIV